MVDEDRCQVSYGCTCGCHPGVEYRRGAPTCEIQRLLLRGFVCGVTGRGSGAAGRYNR